MFMLIYNNNTELSGNANNVNKKVDFLYKKSFMSLNKKTKIHDF